MQDVARCQDMLVASDRCLVASFMKEMTTEDAENIVQASRSVSDVFEKIYRLNKAGKKLAYPDQWQSRISPRLAQCLRGVCS